MKVQRIQIEQQIMQIRVDSQMATLRVQMPRRIMSVMQQRAQMSAEQTRPEISLDMESFRDQLGLKSVYTVTEERVAMAQAQVTQGIREFAADADFIGTLPSSGNPIAEVARRKMIENKAPVKDGPAVPPGAIKMEGKPGELIIDWKKHDLKINWNEFQSPVITVEPKASVEVYVVQEPVFEVELVEQSIPPETGGTVDAEA